MNFETARNQMLAQQIRTWNVLDDRVLDVMRMTQRERFVPPAERDLAFTDSEIPLGHGQAMMNPKIEGRVLQELALEGIEDVLEIGTGSGYLTACLAQLTRSVHSIEIFEDLAAAGASNIEAMAPGNVKLETGDGLALSGTALYDAIAVTGSVPALPDQLVGLLKPGGRMFVVVGHAPAMEAQLITKHADGNWSVDSLFETVLTPLVNSAAAEPFVL